MIHLSKVRAVFVKELRDSLRDRRTIFATIAVPLLLYPIMVLLLGEATQMAHSKRERTQYRVAVDPPSETAFFSSLLELKGTPGAAAPRTKGESRSKDPEGLSKEVGASTIVVPRLLFETVPNPEQELREGRIQAIVRVPSGFRGLVESAANEALSSDHSPEVEILYDQAEHGSRDSVDRLRTLLTNYHGQVVSQRLKQRGLGDAFVVPFRIKDPENVAAAEKVAGSTLGSIIPLLFIMMIIMGATYPAIDLTAGEKERSTLETLIAAPILPLEAIAGKFLTVATLATTNALLNVLSFAFTMTLLGVDRMAELQFPWTALPAVLLLLLPLTFFFSGLLLAVSSFATSSKEAQVYCMPVYLVPMLGMMIVGIPGIELEGPLLVAPVVNTGLLIKEIFLGHPNLERPFVFVFVSTALYAAAAVALAARVFAREEVLFSAQGSLRLFLNRRFFKPQAGPRPADALLVMALLFPIFFYFSAALQRLLIQGGALNDPGIVAALIVAPQVLVLMGVPVFASWYLRLDLANTFLWRRPRPRALLAGVCLGGSSWVLAFQVLAWQSRVWPAPRIPDFMNLEELPTALAVALVALTPAICEEHLFRGFLLSGLRRDRHRTFAVLLSGILFGAFHFSLYRQPITSLLGFALGFLAWESRSLWPGIAFHLLHNGLSLTLATQLFPQGPDESGALSAPDPLYVLPAAAVFAGGLMLARGSGKSNGEVPETATPG